MSFQRLPQSLLPHFGHFYPAGKPVPPPYIVIWHCDYGADEIYELSVEDFSVIRSAPSPYTEPRGVGGDTETIWHLDEDADMVYELSITDFSVIRSASSPSTFPSGIGGKTNVIWHCDADVDLIYELSVMDFSIIRSASTPKTSPEGVGGNAGTIWHCDFWYYVYELSTVDFSTLRYRVIVTWLGGIGGDFNTIWLSDYDALAVHELSVEDLSTVRSAPTPGTYPMGIGGE